ncbi:hypothetical protein PHYBLDRAFT_169968 [Phycomyces blakesleeanus NRRL 1555(-)]|uniref:Uncharacterized protein n=1 Tax=Phycomyces blakesleeanus (strain ATCC 8743b / DSM 1359 / FGSC 10004 / NBRC 33097 / NRRL 1555) TaxID=763407 RepID=A0A167M7W3_PHYB8|nr:hypothetical protein PHYBLDRAFT_169968 [Phycomyces blakesleeanus NRRL 1555(-)]OAD72064.1 hypothetical protein PHYBLDRAFT_169968 [Phycomyces blakesleeanus NRRL 1555(-)]|eukprot:XP_018290104.1 hypothetical protein PHYBLDRAFT_169968 [Phycomyces blakesleeanus NRRL 1555(-)]
MFYTLHQGTQEKECVLMKTRLLGTVKAINDTLLTGDSTAENIYLADFETGLQDRPVTYVLKAWKEEIDYLTSRGNTGYVSLEILSIWLSSPRISSEIERRSFSKTAYFLPHVLMFLYCIQ